MTETVTKPKSKRRKHPRRRVIQMRQRLKKFNRLWPELFDLNAVKPLKVGIDQELLADAQQRGIEMPLEHISRFLAKWTHRHAYWRATYKGEYRHGLNGELIPLTDAERDSARAWKEASQTQFFASKNNPRNQK